MDITKLTLKEKLILTAGVRLFLWELYKVGGLLPNEKEISEIIVKEFPRPGEQKESDVDIVRELAEELYSKLAYRILEDKK